MELFIGIVMVVAAIIQLYFATKAFNVYKRQSRDMSSPQISVYGYLYGFFIAVVLFLVGISLLL